MIKFITFCLFLLISTPLVQAQELNEKEKSLTYPSVGFYFQVKVENETYSFKEVSGLSAGIDTMEIEEGGENRFKYKVPTNVKSNNLELKRGLIPENSILMKWITETIEMGFSNKIEPKTVEVSLLNEKGDIVMLWNFIGAWPVGYNSAPLNALNNEILIESISLSYNYFTTKIIH